MIVADAIPALGRRLRRPVATIGNFDGVHRGHQAILARVIERARAAGAPTLVVTFDPHPIKVLAPDRAPRMIATRRQKLSIIEAAGIDAVLVLPFDRQLAAVTAEAFVRGHLAEGLGVREVYVGESFNFGRGREGTADTLVELCARHGIAAGKVPEVRFLGSPVSSSRIRRAVQAGEVELARELLGRPLAIEGSIAHGSGRGATIGIPTANLLPENELLPQEGVYVTQALVDGTPRSAVTNIGMRPTFSTPSFAVETHILDGEPDLYGRPMEIAFLARLRQELRFDSVRELVEQIRRDIARARAWFAAGGAGSV